MPVSDSAVGAILEIPPTLLADIQKAERYIDNLQITSKRAADAVKTHWGEIATSGLDTFIQRLADAQEKMKIVSGGKIDFNINTQPLENKLNDVSNATKKTANDVSSTVQTLAWENIDFSNMERLKLYFDTFPAQFKSIKATIESMERSFSAMTTEDPESQNLANKIQLLREYYDLRKKSEEQLKTKTAVFDQGVLNDQKTLLQQILQYQKDINAEALRQKRVTKLGGTIPQEDIDRLRNYREKLEELSKSYDTLKGKIDQMSTAGQSKFNAEDVKHTLAMSREQTATDEKRGQALQMVSKYLSDIKLKSAGISSREEGIYMNEQVGVYRQMIDLIKKRGEVEAQVASQGYAQTSAQTNLLQTIQSEYDRLNASLSKVTGNYTEIDRAVSSAFDKAKTMQEAENAAKLADAYQKAADAADKKRKAEAKTEQTDLSKDRAEYKRVLTLIEQIEKAWRKVNDALANTTLPTNLAQQLQSSQAAAEATLNNLYNRRAELEAKRGQELVDIQHQNEAKKGAAAVAEHERAEKEKTRISRQEATDRYNEEMRQARLQNQSLTAQGKQQRMTINDAKEQRAIELAQQRQKEVDRLRQEIDKLDKQDVNYQKDLDRLNQRINELLGTTQRRVSYTREEAMAMAKSASTLREYENAYKALKDAMATTNIKDNKKEWEEMNSQLQQTKKNIDEIKKKMGEFQSQASKTSNIMGQLQGRIAAAFSIGAITGFIKKMVEVRAQFELQRVALGAILQDSQRANQVFVEVQQMALQSPFSIMQLERATKQIAAFGFEADKLKPTLKMLADMSAGLGVEIDRLVLVMGHLKARGFLEGTMVRQFTNAGFNILGGLADYYSELEGKMVSVGEVQDRVKKKMVAFGDVEEVLKRVTSAGGMFYDMQKKQADSIWGQMQRITDAYDLMLNEIGQNNQTAISAALTSIRFLISNWKTLVNIVVGATAAVGFYKGQILLASIATNGLAASQSRLAKAFIATISSLKKMYAFLLANPYTLLVAGAVAAGGALLDLRKKVDAAHESYANIIIGLGDRQKKLNDIVDRIASSNDKITATNDAVNKATKGTFEYNSAVADNKEALAEQYRVLQELRTTFPEVYNNIVKTKDGTVDLTRALEEFNRVSKMVTILTTMTDEDTHWYNEDFKTDMADLSKSQEKYNAQLAKAEAYFNSYTAKAEALYNTRKAQGDLSDKDEAKFKRILAIRDSEMTIEEKIQESIKNGYRFKDNWISDLKENIVKLDNAFQPIKSTGKNKGTLFKDLTSDIAEAEREVNAMVQRVLVAAGVTNIEEFQKLPDETKKAAEQASQHMVKESGIALDEIQKDILHRNWEIPLQMKVIPESVEPGLSYLQEKINEYIDKHPEVEMPKIKADEGTDNYFKKLKNSRKDDIEDQKQYNAATVQLDEERTNAQAVVALKGREVARKAMMDYFGIIEDSKKRGSKSEDKELKWWQDLKKAIDDTKTSYDNYRKRFSVEESNRRIEQEYGPIFKELGVDIRDFYKNGKYDAEELINALAVLKGMVKETTEARKKFSHDISREQTKTQVEIDIKLREQSIQDFQKEVNKMFDNYALTKELGNLGVSVDLAYMVGGKPTTLADIRREYERLMADFASKSEEEQKIISKMGEDLMKKEYDNRKKQLQNYIKYLTESMGERAQIEIKALQDVNKIRDDETLDSFSKEQAVMQRRKKMYEELSKMDLDSLKSSDVYISVFKDLESASKEQLQYVLDKLRELQSTFKDLSPAQVKSIASEMKKIEDALADKDSVKNLGSNLREAIKYARQRNELLREQTKIQDTINKREDSLARGQAYLYELQIKLKGIQDESSDEWQEANRRVQEQQSFVKELQEQIEELKRQLEEVTGKINDGESAWDKWHKGITKVAQYIDATKQVLDDIFEGIGAVFNIDDATRDAFESISEIMGGLSKTANGLAEIDLVRPFTIITGLGKAIGGVFSTIGGFFGIGDKKKERQIQNLTEKVETLDKAYQRLEKSIEDAYRFDDYNAGYSQMQKNLEAQKTAYEEMIRLEEAKKKTDDAKIKEYKDKIQELTDAQSELRKERIETMGSTTDYLSEAQSFVDAWLDAYKETGNGLDALNESWEEFIENLFVKQGAAQIVSARLKKVIDTVNAAIDSGATDFNLADAVNKAREQWKAEAEKIEPLLEQLFGSYGLGDGTGELILSDLQKGIQNITEPQAAAIEAYLNSMRFAVFRHTEQLDTLIATIQMQYGAGAENPVVTELKGIRGVLDSIDRRLGSVINTQGRNATLRIGAN